jgi:hypothetical protein
MHHPIFVLNPNGDKVGDTHREKADRMVELKQAKYMANGRGVRLLGFTPAHEHLCRTHTSRGGLLAAIGRGQQYTTSTHGRVDGFKKIFAEDRGFFNAATLDCKAGHLRVISIDIQAGDGKMHHFAFAETHVVIARELGRRMLKTLEAVEAS